MVNEIMDVVRPVNAGTRLTTTFELLEQILLETPVATIRSAQRVNKNFFSTISNSQPVQSKLYFLRNRVKRYEEVADAVNRREMERFIDEVRERWHPEQLDEFDPGWGDNGQKGEGWTSEGGLALCIWQLTFERHDTPIREGELCEAERWNQILLHPPIDAFADEIPKPLAEPQGEVEKHLVKLREQLQEQSDREVAINANWPPLPTDYYDLDYRIQAEARDQRRSAGKLAADAQAAEGSGGPTDSSMRLSLPSDFKELMTMTDGINGAGVPAEHEHTRLVHPLDDHHADAKELEGVVNWLEPYCTVLGAWKIGQSGPWEQPWREIYFVSCYSTSRETAADAGWKVYEISRSGCWREQYEGMAEFLQHEISNLEEQLAGHEEFHSLDRDTYPPF